MAKICFSERYEVKSARGKGMWGEVQRKGGQAISELYVCYMCDSLSEVTQDALNSSGSKL